MLLKSSHQACPRHVEPEHPARSRRHAAGNPWCDCVYNGWGVHQGLVSYVPENQVKEPCKA